ncbi:NERD domain-containing protein [Desulfosporosinus sp.]|uniref:NERD domain-containing protein n=1 Tax=Desulfosporosinus sp. TaxID=157907 RepID=UPI0025BB5486|nr:NERD domain-containing protein [Desulfosporosinus sp.]MBC2724269.1 NERD domain-containing protein [Desulfosporosinus sp.]MBC2726023.1 NERD domain-containing protein [Desulfosporosinus sp.]
MTNAFLELWYLWLLVLVVFVYGLYKPKIKGIIGEKTISAFLTRLDPTKYKVINDLMLRVDGKTSQIDHVVVSNYGIFVIETKNYKGWIYGDEYGESWTQVIYKRKEKFFNPIRQNYGHIQALKQNLQEYQELNYVPIIVFSIDADLKVKTNTKVIYSVELLKTIKGFTAETITDQQKEEIYSKLLALNVSDKEARTQHVEGIHKKKAKVANQVSANSCPKCGGELITRKGKYGDFKGCKNYPKCRFTIAN